MYSRLLKKEIIYNVHAAQRSIEREIPAKILLETVDNPSTNVSLQKNGRMKFKKDNLIIIAEMKNNALWIITAYYD